jgi:hypothetical protein
MDTRSHGLASAQPEAAQNVRKLNMGAGCVSMFAVILAIALIGSGVGRITGLSGAKLDGWVAILEGVGGLAAFAFFGYWVTAASSHDQGGRGDRSRNSLG